MHRELTSPRRLGPVVVALATAGIGPAGCAEPDRPPAPFTLVVATTAPERPNVRVRLAPGTSPEDAEAVQTELTRKALATRSVLRAPFETIDVTVTGGDVDRSVEQLRASVLANRHVAGVERCPCPPEEEETPSGYRVHKLQRRCGASPPPRRAAGCVNEFVRLQARPVVHNPGNIMVTHYALVFDAAAWPADEHQVRRLKARVTSGEGKRLASASKDGSMMTWKAPLSEQELPASDPTALIHLAGFEQLDERARLSPGRIRSWAFADQIFHVSSIPDRSAPAPTMVKGGVVASVPVPRALDSGYRLIVYF